jgi:mannose/fructose/N-acetylgalactosamine-specific phosphotransferase system component IIC
LILAALLGGLAGADRTAVGQTLLAHPAVAAGLAGWLVGAPAEGIWLGFCLTLLMQRNLPVGYESLRDTTSVAIAIPLAAGANAPTWAFGTALVLGLILARPAGRTIHLLRMLALGNRIRLRERLEAGELPRLEFYHFGMSFLHFLRGLLVTSILALLLHLALVLGDSFFDESARRTFEAIWWSAPLLGVGALLLQRTRLPWILLGLGAASVGLLLWGAT